jgi:hypothetical protein
MAHEKTWLRHEIEVEGKNDAKTRDWITNGEPSPGLYRNLKGDVDSHDARGLYAEASLSGDGGPNRNLSRDQF